MQRLLLRAERLRRASCHPLTLQQLATHGCASTSAWSGEYAWQQPQLCASSRAYSSSQGDEGQQDVSSIGNEKVQKLAEEVLALSVLECSWLSEILRKRLNLQKPAFGAMPMMAAMGAPAPAAPAAGGEEAAPAEAKKEKTEFAVKLEGFSPEGKIKVIKEIRAITSLGLKEAKELVEKAPVMVKAGLSKADAEAMQKQLEGVGGKVALE